MAEKTFLQLSDLAKRCKCDVADLLHQAGLGVLKLSILFYGAPSRNLHLRMQVNYVGPTNHPDSGIFDLHLEDVIALIKSDEIAIAAIFSPCGNWTLTFDPYRVVRLSDVVVRLEEAQDFESGFDLVSPVSDTERSRLLRQIAGMALLIAAENKIYKVGDGPSADAIAESVGGVFDELPNANLKGLGKTNIRTAISAGLKLLGK